MNEPTMDKLRTLRLTALADAWAAQKSRADMSALSFDERLALLVDAEWLSRDNKRLARLLREATLRISSACTENVDTAPSRGLDRSLMRELAQCRWIDEHLNIVVTGATGTGKTYLACALGHAACRKGYRVLYRRASRLADELRLAAADGSYARLLAKLARMDVLIIDDWGHAPIKDQERRDLVELFDDRYGAKSTIVTSQLPTAKWHEHIGDPTQADALCDRILHNAHRLVVHGESRRKESKIQNN